jgi:hypothetical protein
MRAHRGGDGSARLPHHEQKDDEEAYGREDVERKRTAVVQEPTELLARLVSLTGQTLGEEPRPFRRLPAEAPEDRGEHEEREAARQPPFAETLVRHCDEPEASREDGQASNADERDPGSRCAEKQRDLGRPLASPGGDETGSGDRHSPGEDDDADEVQEKRPHVLGHTLIIRARVSAGRSWRSRSGCQRCDPGMETSLSSREKDRCHEHKARVRSGYAIV